MVKSGYSTEKKNKILSCLKENAHIDLTVKDIERYLVEHDMKVNLTTIYRNLDKLEKDGLIVRRGDETGNKATYQYVEPDQNCHDHLHLKCSSCGKIYHMDCSFMNELKQHIFNHHGFMLECKTSMIYGTCKECCSQNFDNSDKK